MIILASASPRRREILGAAGFKFKVAPANGEEIIPENCSPEEAVKALALQKAEEVFKSSKGDIIIGADTVVVLNKAILGKPKDEQDAFDMLRTLSGRKHIVYTGVAVISDNRREVFAEKTEAEFHELSDAEITDYIKTKEPFDKAGAYGIQGFGANLVKGIVGDFYNVMGLPIGRLSRVLKDFGEIPDLIPNLTQDLTPDLIKESYNITDLIDIMATLRGKGSAPEKFCPWDVEQTHESIRENVIEEAYETAQAIDEGNAEHLKEELGDLLLQVIFHAQIAREAGDFDFNNVCDGICKKLIYRHPHVFGEINVASSSEVLKNWDNLKSASKNETSVADRLESVPILLPALTRGEKVGKRAGNAGFDFDNVEQIIQTLRSEVDELELALRSEENGNIEAELGDILFSCCNLGRFLKKNCEKALTISLNKFIMRFRELENSVLSSYNLEVNSARDASKINGVQAVSEALSGLSRDELDRLWRDAKEKVNRAEET